MHRVYHGSLLRRLILSLAITAMVSDGAHSQDAQPTSQPTSDSQPPAIEIWYGHKQRFGHRGVPQKWVNVLGRVTAYQAVVVTYRLNHGDPRSLALGPNYTRLAEKGDFNVEIAVDELRSGENELTISAVGGNGESVSATVAVTWSPQENVTLPLHVDWSKAKSIQDVAQIVDGRWTLTDQGVRSVEPYYDRVIALGTGNWNDYQIETTVTFHARRLPGDRDGGRNVIHAALASRWPGHDDDGKQPRVKWYPLGATSEFMVTDWPDGCRWRILGGSGRPRHSYQDKTRTIGFDVLYGIKHLVRTRGDGATEYRVKLWPANTAEPEPWDLIGVEQPDDVHQGGALLIAHYTDVTFGNVTITAVP